MTFEMFELEAFDLIFSLAAIKYSVLANISHKAFVFALAYKFYLEKRYKDTSHL